MDIDIAKEKATSLLNTHNLQDWKVSFTSSKDLFGVCIVSKKEIKLSSILTYLNNESIVIETVLHEIAHAIDSENRGYSNHDYHWRKIAMAIGSNGDRCYNRDSINVPVGRFIYVCPECGKENHHHRRLKRANACGVCCKKYNFGKYTNEYALVLKETS